LEARAAIEGGQRGTAAYAICYAYPPLSDGGDVPLMLRRLDSATINPLLSSLPPGTLWGWWRHLLPSGQSALIGV
jgi:hypothetical protein